MSVTATPSSSKPSLPKSSPASKSIASKLPSLVNAATRLNKVADLAAAEVRSLEIFLREQCNLGVEVSIRTCEFSDGDTEFLAYMKIGRDWRLAVSVLDFTNQPSHKPWSDCDRGTKMRTLEHFPALIDAITATVEEQTKQAEAAVEYVRDVSDSLPF